MPHIKLTYFDLPGRAEPIRLFLKLSGIEFEDHRIEYSTWLEVKPSYGPYFQLPVLEFDGKRISQSNNILLFLADYFCKDNALVPANLVERYQCFQHIYALDDVLSSFYHTMSIEDKNAAIEARIIHISPGGATFEKFSKINDILKTQHYLHGDHITLPDLNLLSFICNLTSGQIEGIDREIISKNFPETVEFIKRILSDERINNIYKDVTAPWVKNYRGW